MEDQNCVQKLVAYLVHLQQIMLPQIDVKWLGLSSGWSRQQLQQSERHLAEILLRVCFHRLSTQNYVICSTGYALDIFNILHFLQFHCV